MHKRLLATLLTAMLGSSFAAQAIELSVEEKQQMLSDAQSLKSAQRIVSLALSEQSDQANFNLLRIKQPQQEVVRFLAIKSISESAPQYTSDLAVFVDTQRKVAPSLKIVEQGDGFRFVSPAFSYQLMAQRLIDDWKLNDQVIALYVGVENELGEVPANLHLVCGAIGGAVLITSLLTKVLADGVEVEGEATCFTVFSTKLELVLNAVGEDGRG